MSAPHWPTLLEQAKQLLKQDQPEETATLLRAALTGGGPPMLWRLLALALRQQGRLSETLEIQRQVVDATPGDLDARFDLAETLLLLGDFDRGWREYRFRYRLTHTRQYERKVQPPRWEGRAMSGGTLLIHDEQGYGDTLQFMRLVALARKQSGARVVLEVMPELLPLAQRMGGYDQIIARGELPPPFDMHCELMGLPQALRLQMASLPGPMPYLTADPARLDLWRQRLQSVPRPWVALTWAGRPTHSNDHHRSLHLADLAPLARPDISFLALQKGPAAVQAETPPPGMSVLALDRHITDFEDSAAILTLADLLISIDSSPAHLAGALGRPAWVLLPFVPDWRWLTQRSDSPWYPSLRLFRQPARNDWPSTLAQVSMALDLWQRERT
jgi:hypothetical protein